MHSNYKPSPKRKTIFTFLFYGDETIFFVPSFFTSYLFSSLCYVPSSFLYLIWHFYMFSLHHSIFLSIFSFFSSVSHLVFTCSVTSTPTCLIQILRGRCKSNMRKIRAQIQCRGPNSRIPRFEKYFGPTYLWMKLKQKYVYMPYHAVVSHDSVTSATDSLSNLILNRYVNIAHWRTLQAVTPMRGSTNYAETQPPSSCALCV
jgi:hypothetical protein